LDDGDKLLVFNLIGLFRMGHELGMEKADNLEAEDLKVSVV